MLQAIVILISIFLALPCYAESPFNNTLPPKYEAFIAEMNSPRINALIEGLTRRTIAEEHAITRGDFAGTSTEIVSEPPVGSTNSFSQGINRSLAEAFRQQRQDYQYKKSLADGYGR